MEKIMLCADLHLKDGLFLQVGLEFIDNMKNYGKNHGINKIVFHGDILDRSNKIKSEIFVPLFKKIEELKEDGFEMWFIIGNHDMISTLTNASLLEVFEKYGHLVNSMQTYEIDGIKINMCPFTKDEMNVPTINADYLFTHLNVSGFEMSAGKISGEEQQAFPVSMFSNYKKVFTGHYHKRQQLENIEYIGSPYQLDFGECGDCNKGFVVFEPFTGKEELVVYENAPRFEKWKYNDLWNRIREEKNGFTFVNKFIRVIVGKKVDKLAELKTLLYNEYCAIDVSYEFEENKASCNSASIDIDSDSSNIYDMVLKFISNHDIIEKNGFEIKGEELASLFSNTVGATI